MTNGEKLKEIRRVIGQVEKCTQADFAEMIGTTTGMVGYMEVGIRRVTPNFKRKIYEATGAEFIDEYDYPVVYNKETETYERFTRLNIKPTTRLERLLNLVKDKNQEDIEKILEGFITFESFDPVVKEAIVKFLVGINLELNDQQDKDTKSGKIRDNLDESLRGLYDAFEKILYMERLPIPIKHYITGEVIVPRKKRITKTMIYNLILASKYIDGQGSPVEIELIRLVKRHETTKNQQLRSRTNC